MSFFETIKAFLSPEPAAGATVAERPPLDAKLAGAALMVQVIAADGTIKPAEEARLSAILRDNYGLSDSEAEELRSAAMQAQDNSVDLYGFTSILKRDMSEDDRLALIENLWEMVYADGELHEFEDNVVWRVAELVGVQTRARMELKKRVQERQGEG